MMKELEEYAKQLNVSLDELVRGYEMQQQGLKTESELKYEEMKRKIDLMRYDEQVEFRASLLGGIEESLYNIENGGLDQKEIEIKLNKNDLINLVNSTKPSLDDCMKLDNIKVMEFCGNGWNPDWKWDDYYLRQLSVKELWALYCKYRKVDI